MNIVKKIIFGLYSFYSLLVFFTLMVVAFILYVFISPLSRNPRMRIVYRINKVWISTWGLLTGLWISYKGNEHIEREQPYVFLSNHRNLLDIVMTGSTIQHPFQPLIKEELLKVPLFGILLRWTSVPVNRDNAESRKVSFDRMVDRIKTGTSILIFPEGTRNQTEHPLKDFYSGAFRLAVETQVPIIPVVLLNIRNKQPVRTFWIFPGIVRLHILPPVPTKGLTMEDLPQLVDRVHETMWNHLVANDKVFENYQEDRKEVLEKLNQKKKERQRQKANQESRS